MTDEQALAAMVLEGYRFVVSTNRTKKSYWLDVYTPEGRFQATAPLVKGKAYLDWMDDKPNDMLQKAMRQAARTL